ncbi:MAG: hypothetical protein EBS32_06275 [Actinobacteria bacterium]|nr:hypothetical protein [Actinomycetota bacterium]
MLTAKVTQSNGHVVHVRLVQSDSTTDTTVVTGDTVAPLAMAASGEGEATTEVAKSAPNPIAPESKELYWAAGSFIVLFILMRFFFFPKIKQGMEARYAGIRGNIEGADKVKADARGDVAEYEKALDAVRAEADAANAAARAAVRDQVAAAVTQVASKAAELATGRTPDAATVQQAVTAAMESAGSR